MTGDRPARDVALSFGADAERYHRTRPGYPAALADLVLRDLRVAGPAPSALDVGTGTGSAASLFRAAGCQVTGVEPDERMAAVARRAGLTVEIASFDGWDAEGRTFDVVLSGQAWHWVRPLDGAAKAASLLHDGGRLAVFWNIARPEPDLAAALAATYRDVRLGGGAVPWRGSPTAGYERLARGALSGIWASRRFEKVTRHDVEWRVEYTTEQWIDHVPTLTWHDRLPAEVLARLVDANAEVVESFGGKVGIPHTTLTLVASRERVGLAGRASGARSDPR